MKPQKLSQTQIQKSLRKLAGWKLSSGKLARDFLFADFIAAFGFMAKAALISEKMNHHPEWFNVYNKVQVRLSTHECEGISKLDFEWAAKVNKLYRGVHEVVAE